jgi:chromosome segregation ATPase
MAMRAYDDLHEEVIPMEPRSTPKSTLIHQDHENRLTRVEVVMENICTSLSDIKSDIKVMRSEIKQDINRLDTKMDNGFNAMNNRIDSNFKWLLGIMIGGFVSISGVIAHLQHWL